MNCGSWGELFGLINNAGEMLSELIEHVTMDQFKEEMEVNYFGTVSVTKKLLPNIKRSKGRIINISSINGKLSMLACGGYSESKFALEAFSDELRMELLNTGVKVCLIEPGQVKTAIFNKAIESYNKLSEHRKECDKQYYGKLLNTLEGAMATGYNSDTTPDQVSDIVYEILNLDEPETRYILWEKMQSIS